MVRDIVVAPFVVTRRCHSSMSLVIATRQMSRDARRQRLHMLPDHGKSPSIAGKASDPLARQRLKNAKCVVINIAAIVTREWNGRRSKMLKSTG